MCPIFEFVCSDPKCERFEHIIEELCKTDEELRCDLCSIPLTKLTSACNGYVKGPDAMSNKVNHKRRR